MRNPYKDLSNIDPQPGMPHRQVERSVFRALMAAGLPGPEYQLVLTVIDKTWGYQKREDVIPLSQFEESTHLDRRNINHYLSRLEQKHIIIIQRSGPGRGKGNLYMFNKHWDTWKLDKAYVQHLLALNGVPETPLPEIASQEHQLNLNGVGATPLPNSVQDTPLSAGNSVKSAGNSVQDTLGNSVQDTPSIERGKKLSQEKTSSKEEEGGASPPATYGALTEASRYLFEKTGRKRWANVVQKETFEAAEVEFGYANLKAGIDWALVKGIKDISAMITTAKKRFKEYGKGGDSHDQRQEGAREGRPEEARVDSGGRDRPGGFRVIESGDPGSGDGD